MTPSDRRAERHAATKQQIVAAAWRLTRERGLGGWALRDVAASVGMRAPSLYVYFDSKHALFDAMFAEGNAELLRRMAAIVGGTGATPAETLTDGALVFFDFCVEEPARYQLLFLRTIPGFEPSEGSYGLAQEALRQMTAALRRSGVDRREHVDLWTATISGLVAQQISNDPGGDRWRRLVAPAVEMLLSGPGPSSANSGPSAADRHEFA